MVINIILFIEAENESAGIANLQVDIATIDVSQFADGTGVMVVLGLTLVLALQQLNLMATTQLA